MRKFQTTSMAGFSTFSHTPASISSDSFTPASQTLINASNNGNTYCLRKLHTASIAGFNTFSHTSANAASSTLAAAM